MVYDIYNKGTGKWSDTNLEHLFNDFLMDDYDDPNLIHNLAVYVQHYFPDVTVNVSKDILTSATSAVNFVSEFGVIGIRKLDHEDLKDIDMYYLDRGVLYEAMLTPYNDNYNTIDFSLVYATNPISAALLALVQVMRDIYDARNNNVVELFPSGATKIPKS